ncbi:MAG: hypothetical protein ABW123_07560 [Cystobacter sp.]
MATQHKVGGEVDAFCTRCRLTLAHTILAMVGTKIARVRCNTCNGDHAFRSAPGSTDKPSSSSRSSSGSGTPRAPRASRSSEDKVIISFEEQLAGKDIANAPRYSAKESFKVDQVIQHPTFGLGLVTAVRGNKVDITFKSETKTLLHAAGGATTERPAFSPPNAKRAGPADKPMAAPTEEPDEAPADSIEG